MDKEYRRFEGIQVAGDGEAILVSGKHTYGYKKPCGHRRVECKGKYYLVHRLVAECFLNDGKPLPDGYDVHHKNGNPEDNRVENLIILTHEEHMALHHKGKHHTTETKRKLSDAALKKPVIGINKVTGEVLEFESGKDAALTLNINIGNISSCLTGKRQSAGGWWFVYKKTP